MTLTITINSVQTLQADLTTVLQKTTAFQWEMVSSVVLPPVEPHIYLLPADTLSLRAKVITMLRLEGVELRRVFGVMHGALPSLAANTP
jgi:hypothetical protein